VSVKKKIMNPLSIFNKSAITALFILSGVILSGSFAGASMNLPEDQYTRRHFYGGYIGVDMGLINQFEGAPFFGYMLTPGWHVGAGGKYQYHYDKRLGNVFRAHIYGPFAFTDLIVVGNLNELFSFRLIEASFFLHAEMNLLSLPSKHFDFDNQHTGKTRFLQPTPLVGAGLRRHAGGDRSIQILLMMDVSGDSRIIYSNPVLRFGFTF
jgi:hypothetical protein